MIVNDDAKVAAAVDQLSMRPADTQSQPFLRHNGVTAVSSMPVPARFSSGQELMEETTPLNVMDRQHNRLEFRYQLLKKSGIVELRSGCSVFPLYILLFFNFCPPAVRYE